MAPQAEAKYRIRNWSNYNKALVQRGSLTIWFSPEAIEKWSAEKEHKKGRPRKYSNDAILCALMLKSVYRLPLRALCGLLMSLVSLMGLALPIPCYTRICRRAKELGQEIKRLGTKRPTDIVFDSTGLKVFGEGEWKVRQHGAGKRRTWRKLHLAICPDSHDIVLEYVTSSGTTDSEGFSAMGQRLPGTIERAYADGAYDKEGCYKGLSERGITPVIPPQKNAVMRDSEKKPWLKSRNEALFMIRGLGDDEDARKLWKKLSKYHKRSLVETAMFRFKTLFGGSLGCRKMSNQRAEVYAKCLVINRMNALGMPKGEWIKF